MDLVTQIGMPTTLKISSSRDYPFSRNMRSKVKRSRSTAKKTTKIAKKPSKHIFLKKFISIFLSGM